MLFNSYIFIFLFYPLCTAGYFLLNRSGRFSAAKAFLLAMSLWFYAYFNFSYLLIILSSICVNFLLAKLMYRSISSGRRRLYFILSLIFNLGLIFYFKYFDFFISNINAVFHSHIRLFEILLPLGISFFTFQQISYSADVYRGEFSPCGFLDYACFVSYFPQLIAGPIVSHDELIPQLQDVSRKHFCWENFSQGLFLFVLGLGKKVLIADTFGNAANWGFANIQALDSTNAILTSLAYTFQLYFDFSGYCDMASGIALSMNIVLPLNFNSPYKSLRISEFWSRWHITLTRFFRKYVYIPLGGNRKGRPRCYLNIMIVFLLSGLWHGASWSFVLWGALHGLFMLLERHFRFLFDRLPKLIGWIICFTFINLTWVFFRADSINGASELIARMFTGGFGPVAEGLSSAFMLPEFVKPAALIGLLTNGSFTAYLPSLFTALAFAGALIIVLVPENSHELALRFKPTVLSMLCCTIIFLWSVMSLSGVSTFLYFNF